MSTAVITREEAIDVGLVRFWDGVPCERGHVGERYAVNRACVECNIGKLTPAQFAYIFRGGPGTPDEFNDKRKTMQTWAEWESWYTKWTVEQEPEPAPEKAAYVKPPLTTAQRRLRELASRQPKRQPDHRSAPVDAPWKSDSAPSRGMPA